MTDSQHLWMGIWSDDGTVWLPKKDHPKRSQAKSFAVQEMDAVYIDVRVRTRWMVRDDDGGECGFDVCYVVCNPGDDGAFECWEITHK